jgi:twinkle protein
MSAHIVGPAELCASVEALWDRGLPPGDRTGWPSLDRLYTVLLGLVTIVTGWPGAGKSEWLDALLVNLWFLGWRFAIFSPENQPIELHASKLLEKVSGKPFGRGPTERLTREELRTLMVDELAGHFAFVRAEAETPLTVQAVLDAAEPWLARFEGAKRGLVIDPWNELEHGRPSNLSETEYISQQLSLLRNWARANQVHVWVVAHPQKMRRDDAGKLPIPRPDMISGSQHWWNKADAAITVHRDLGAESDSPAVEIHVMKVRFKHIGRPGLAVLHYDRVTGRYHEPPSAKPAAVPSRWDLREGEA